MRRSTRRRLHSASPASNRREMQRLVSMLVMLAVVAMLMMRARDPNLWRWLTNEDSDTSQATDGGQQASADSDEQTAADGTDASRIRPGPTDEDPEEADAAREEFQAITDRTIDLQPEEMPAYKRLLKWVENQPLPALQKRSRRDVVFTHLMQSPDKFRGQLVHLDLHLRRLLKHPIDENAAGANEVYEAWGFSNESGVWLYEIIFVDVPPSMPLNKDLQEDVSFDGYFLKLQGYYEAGATPRAAPLAAPLLIGRIVWHPVSTRQASNPEWFWLTIAGGGLLLLLIIGGWVRGHLSRPTSAATTSTTPAGESVESWLARAQHGEAVSNDEVNDDNGAGGPRDDVP